MSTQISVGMDNARDGYQSGQRAARAALDSFRQNGRARSQPLALLFTAHAQPDKVLKGANAALGDIPLIGATAAGVYSHDGYVEDGTGIMLIQSESMTFHPMMHQRKLFGRGKLFNELRGISHEGLGSSFSHRALMLFPDDQSMSLDGVVDRAMTETAMMYDILGGPGPTIPTPPRPPAVFYNNRTLKSGLAGTEILSQQHIGLALTNGWTPTSGPYRVTHVEARKIVKLDGRPAREVYEDFWYDHNISINDAEIRELLLKNPIGVCKDGDCKVAVLMGFDNNGALKTTSPPAEGSLVHILTTRPDAMIAAAQRVIQQARAQLSERPIAGLLFIDCMSTAMVLSESYTQQRDAVLREVGDLPFLGFRSHGVLARLQGQITGHYECSVATCLLPG